MTNVEKIQAEVERLKNELIEARKKGIPSIFDRGRISAFEEIINYLDYTLLWQASEFTEEQIVYIRDEFSTIIDRTDNANDELHLINVCQSILDCPRYESYEQWKKDCSDTWEEIREEDEK